MTPELLKPVENLIWDWNGTLLNDLHFCVETINSLLANRNLPLLTSEKYKEVFSFPVKDYYAKVGFDFSKEDFAIPAREFIIQYNSRVNECNLHKNAIEILEQFKIEGINQYVLSAMKQNKLEETLKDKNIFYFFKDIVGLTDHYAVSKVERGKELISNNNISKDTALMIGDTTHDFEVAEKLGIGCILIANGHQSKGRLEATGTKVLDSLTELW